MIGLMSMAGLRVSELTGLNMNDLSLNENVIRVLGKGSKERTIFLNKDIAKLLKEYLEKRPKTRLDAVFISKRKNRISRHTVHWIVKKLVKNMGLNADISSHSLRHTFATLYHSAGMDIRNLQKLLGHANLSTTEIYTHVTDAILEREIEDKNPF
jgi:site-specific recombinase XerD